MVATDTILSGKSEATNMGERKHANMDYAGQEKGVIREGSHRRIHQTPTMNLSPVAKSEGDGAR